MDVPKVLREREERDRFFAEHYASPIPEEYLEHFSGLDYYPPSEQWVLHGAFRPLPEQKIPVPSSSGGSHPYTVRGAIDVEIAGALHTLTVIDDGDGGAFIPFRDATSGDTTYEGGRYVSVKAAEPGPTIIDFNGARNPWCAYDAEFVCPFPPPGNTIAVAVTAGEKDYRPAVGRDG